MAARSPDVQWRPANTEHYRRFIILVREWANSIMSQLYEHIPWCVVYTSSDSVDEPNVQKRTYSFFLSLSLYQYTDSGFRDPSNPRNPPRVCEPRKLRPNDGDGNYKNTVEVNEYVCVCGVLLPSI